MKSVARRLVVGAGIILGLLLLAFAYLALFFDVNQYKPQLEAAVAKSTGMTLKINGKASLKFLPYLRIALKDVRLSNRGSELFATNAIEVTPRLIPFVLHREILVNQIYLDHPSIHIEKSRTGRMNYESTRAAGTAAGSAPPASEQRRSQIHSLAIDNGQLTYLDHGTGKQLQLRGVNANLSGIAWGGADSSSKNALMKSIVFQGYLRAQSLQMGTLAASNLKSNIRDDHGLIRLDPTEANLYGGIIRGDAEVDMRGATPKLKVVQTASRVDLAQVPSKVQDRVSGLADFSINLAATGISSETLTRTARGVVSLRSHEITLAGVDVDKVAGQLKSLKGLDLAHIGSLILSGPLAPALGPGAGKPSGAARQPSEARTVIHNLISDWTIANGLAQAKDVAFTTSKNTLAFKGNINLVKKTYQNFYVATVDPDGCSKSKVEIIGSLDRPRPSATSVASQLSRSDLGGQAGAAIGSIGSRIAGMLGSQRGGREESAPSKDETSPKETPTGCDHFYSGAAIRTR